MSRAALAYLSIPASPRPAEARPRTRRIDTSPFSRLPRVHGKPRQGVKNRTGRYAPGLTLKTHANQAGITPVAQEAVVGCSVAAETATARAARLGREGEAAVGITGPKVGVKINGRTRFPVEVGVKKTRSGFDRGGNVLPHIENQASTPGYETR